MSYQKYDLVIERFLLALFDGRLIDWSINLATFVSSKQKKRSKFVRTTSKLLLPHFRRIFCVWKNRTKRVIPEAIDPDGNNRTPCPSGAHRFRLRPFEGWRGVRFVRGCIDVISHVQDRLGFVHQTLLSGSSDRPPWRLVSWLRVSINSRRKIRRTMMRRSRLEGTAQIFRRAGLIAYLSGQGEAVFAVSHSTLWSSLLLLERLL